MIHRLGTPVARRRQSDKALHKVMLVHERTARFEQFQLAAIMPRRSESDAYDPLYVAADGARRRFGGPYPLTALEEVFGPLEADGRGFRPKGPRP